MAGCWEIPELTREVSRWENHGASHRIFQHLDMPLLGIHHWVTLFLGFQHVLAEVLFFEPSGRMICTTAMRS